MRKTLLLSWALTAVLLLSCGQHAQERKAPAVDSTLVSLPGDSTLYGLACDGCTDTLLILLTDVKANPDTFNVLEASMNHRVMGHPAVGDRVGVLLSADSAHTVYQVINIEKLKGSWMYTVTPTLRRRADISDEMQAQFLKKMPDSIRQRLLAPREFGFQLSANNVAVPLGDRMRSDDHSPAVYEKPKRYREWRLFNGRLLLTELHRDSTARETRMTDTAQIVRLTRDTLELSFSTGNRTYYRKK